MSSVAGVVPFVILVLVTSATNEFNSREEKNLKAELVSVLVYVYLQISSLICLR